MVLLRVEVNLAWPSLWISRYLNSVCQLVMIYSLCDYMFQIFLLVILAPPGGKKSNIGAIVGGVIGGILFLILVGAGVFFFLRWKSKYSVLVHSSRKVVWRSNTTLFSQFYRVFLRTQPFLVAGLVSKIGVNQDIHPTGNIYKTFFGKILTV